MRWIISIVASFVSSLSVVLFVAIGGHILKTIKSRVVRRKFRKSILPASVVFDGRE